MHKNKQVSTSEHSHQAVEFLANFQGIWQQDGNNSRDFEKKNLVFITLPNICYRNWWLRKGRGRSGKEQKMAKTT